MSRALAPGVKVAGRYRIDSILASGGMGSVYRATDERLQRDVALKVLLPELAEDVEAIRRFEREGVTSARLNHPGIVQIHDVGRTPDPSGRGTLCFIVMERVLGPTLAEVVEAGPLAPARVIDLGLSALEALACAHQAGITHRDLKPANLMLVSTPEGERVKLVDFGLAQLKSGAVYTRLTQTGAILGTPLFMAPEQARAEPTGPRTDVYALGLVLWTCLTGRAPYSGADLATLMVSVLEEVPPRVDGLVPGVPASLATALEVALQKDPARRFPSAQAFHAALSAARAECARSTPSQAPVSPRIPSTSTPMAFASTQALDLRTAPSGAGRSAPSPAAPTSPRRSLVGVLVALVVVGSLLLAAVSGVALWFASRELEAVSEERSARDRQAEDEARAAGAARREPESSTAAAEPREPDARDVEEVCRIGVVCCELSGAPHDDCQASFDRYDTSLRRESCAGAISGYRAALDAQHRAAPECHLP